MQRKANRSLRQQFRDARRLKHVKPMHFIEIKGKVCTVRNILNAFKMNLILFQTNEMNVDSEMKDGNANRMIYRMENHQAMTRKQAVGGDRNCRVG